MSAPDSFAAVIDLLAEKKLLGEVGIRRTHAGTMKTRGSIPARWFNRIVEVSGANGLPISHELLARLAAQGHGRGGDFLEGELAAS